MNRSSLFRLIRRLFLGCLLIAGAFLARPAYHLVRVALRDSAPAVGIATPSGILDDASRLNPTPVARVIEVPADPDDAIRVIRDALAAARSERLSISIAGSRHSMGGQSLARDGIVLDMRGFDRMSLTHPRGRFTWGAG